MTRCTDYILNRLQHTQIQKTLDDEDDDDEDEDDDEHYYIIFPIKRLEVLI